MKHEIGTKELIVEPLQKCGSILALSHYNSFLTSVHGDETFCFDISSFLFCLCVSVEDALAHPYLTSLHDISDEPICMTPFSFDFEQHALTEEQMKELIYREALAFNPEYQQM